jgi:hypothetical protein
LIFRIIFNVEIWPPYGGESSFLNVDILPPLVWERIAHEC